MKSNDLNNNVSSNTTNFISNNLNNASALIFSLRKKNYQKFINKLESFTNHFQITVGKQGIIANLDDFVLQSKESQTKIILGPDCISTIPNQTWISREFVDSPNISNIGYQRHFVPFGTYAKLDRLSHISLGEVRQQIELAEPILRETNYCIFDLSSIRKSESGLESSNHYGYTIEEACQLARFAGLSSDLHYFQLFWPESTKQLNDQTIEISSLICWYFIEGLNYRQTQRIDDQSKTYIIDSHLVQEPIVFKQSKNTGQWWMQYGENGFQPCLEKDYKAAQQGELPERLLERCMV